MMYLLTEQEHAQIVRIIGDASWHIPESSPLDRDAESALAMLKAMKPVEPSMWAYQYSDKTWHDASATHHSAGMLPLYAKEQQ